MKIYVTDSEKNVCDIIGGFVKTRGYQVVVFETGDALKAEFEEHPSDLVILDLMNPTLNGVDIHDFIRSKTATPIVMVSSNQGYFTQTQSPEGNDYWAKPLSPIELQIQLDGFLRKMNISKEARLQNVLSFGNVEIDIAKDQCKVAGEQVRLTPTEFTLLVYMLEHPNRPISRQELLDHVWQFEKDMPDSACYEVMKRVRKKIQYADVVLPDVPDSGFQLVRKSEEA